MLLAIEFSGLSLIGYALWLIAFSWFVTIAVTLFALARQRLLSSITDLRLTANDAPMVSILVPARNEEHRVLTACIRSILAQDYGTHASGMPACQTRAYPGRFEVIAINDRSTDATGQILKSLATNDDRLQVIEGEEPPPGWLGKPYAMQQALTHARGEWILATDADMIFEPAALRTALAVALERQADAISLIPYFESGSFWERVMIPTWMWVFLMFTVFYRTNDPNSAGAVGIGGFFLMRRAILERVRNYEALRDEVMEDVRLAEMIKQAGGLMLTERAPGLVRTRMYRNFREMWECSTKNWFSGMKFSLPFAMSAVCSMYLGSVGPPLIAIASGIGIAAGAGAGLWRLFIPAALSWLMQVCVLAIASIRSDVSPAYALTAPLGLGVLYAMLFDSSMRITLGKGVLWKGRRIYERSGIRPPQSGSVAGRVSEIKK